MKQFHGPHFTAICGTNVNTGWTTELTFLSYSTTPDSFGAGRCLIYLLVIRLFSALLSTSSQSFDNVLAFCAASSLQFCRGRVKCKHIILLAFL